MVLTPPARIKKKSEISSPIELILSVRALYEPSHLRGLAMPVEDGLNVFSPAGVPPHWRRHPAREPIAFGDGITELAQNVLQGRGRPERPHMHTHTHTCTYTHILYILIHTNTFIHSYIHTYRCVFGYENSSFCAW